jgi:acetyl esterase/lipase
VILTIPPTVHEQLFPRELVKNEYSSLEQNAEAPILPIYRYRAFLDMYKPEPGHPYFSPLIASDDLFRGFPPTCFHIAGSDPLRDEGLLFEEKLRGVGQVDSLNMPDYHLC